ncbi:hypothetical protein AHIS1636_18090 [Arthrobacter mangrovi]|uniref:Uncharacterized protein n=1 Tax=Arthrobacter mangrovi TaxID=2966350 RepID=A0ABQ5MTR6_9MICC|nr:hypothetical protein AHIS1636_18090 [Arthrobacter mangrovi]
MLSGVSSGALVTSGLLMMVGPPVLGGIDVRGSLPGPAGEQPISTTLPSVRTASQARNLRAGAGCRVWSGEIAAFLYLAASFVVQVHKGPAEPAGADVRETSLAHPRSVPGMFRALSTGLMQDRNRIDTERPVCRPWVDGGCVP